MGGVGGLGQVQGGSGGVSFCCGESQCLCVVFEWMHPESRDFGLQLTLRSATG